MTDEEAAAFLRLALTSEEALTIKYPYDVAGYFSESFGQLFDFMAHAKNSDAK